MADEIISIKASILSNLTRKVRDLEAKNDKLEAYMKVISEAARESQTRDRVYSKREGAPTEKRPQRSNGNRVQQRDTGQVLRGNNPMSVDGVQIPTHNSTPYKPRFAKGPSKTKHTPTKVVGKSTH